MRQYLELKTLSIENDGSQLNAAIAMRMDPGVLSRIIRGHRVPTAAELKALRKHFGADAVDKIFPGNGEEAAHGA